MLYVPELRENLLSVSRLTDLGVKVEFNESDAIFTKDGQYLTKAFRNGNLYELKVRIVEREAGISVLDENQLWHKRLGHASDNAVQELVRHQMVTGLSKFQLVFVRYA